MEFLALRVRPVPTASMVWTAKMANLVLRDPRDRLGRPVPMALRDLADPKDRREPMAQ